MKMIEMNFLVIGTCLIAIAIWYFKFQVLPGILLLWGFWLLGGLIINNMEKKKRKRQKETLAQKIVDAGLKGKNLPEEVTDLMMACGRVILYLYYYLMRMAGEDKKAYIQETGKTFDGFKRWASEVYDQLRENEDEVGGLSGLHAKKVQKSEKSSSGKMNTTRKWPILNKREQRLKELKSLAKLKQLIKLQREGKMKKYI